MYFRYTEQANIWNKTESHGTLQVDLGGVNVTLQNSSDKSLRITTQRRVEPGRKLTSFLTKIANGETDNVLATVRADSLSSATGLDQDIREKLSSEVILLSGWGRAAYKTLRWRYNAGKDPEPFSAESLEFSLDGEKWISASSNIQVSIELNEVLAFDGCDSLEIESILDIYDGEPLHHSLLVEADSLNRHGNSKVALIMAVSAMEIGVKNYISWTSPDSDWLIKSFPLPPIAKVIQEYLPTLYSDEGSTFPKLSKPQVKQVEEMVRIRNELIHSHSPKSKVNSQKVDEIIIFVGYVLWLVDYCIGHKWAINYVSKAFWDDLEWTPPTHPNI